MKHPTTRKKYVYQAAKTFFILGAFLFFLNLFFLVGGLYRDIFSVTVFYSFFLCVSAWGFYIFAATQKYVSDICAYSVAPFLLIWVIFSALTLNGGVVFILDLFS